MTYLLYPAAPPWMAAQKGLIPPVKDVFATTLGTFITPGGVPTVYGIMGPNPVAAMPSLHAAYPFLVYLFLVRFYGKKGHLFLPYVLLVWLSIVYTGQHYVIDAIVGALYALVAFAVTEYCWRRFFRHDAAVQPDAGATRPGPVRTPALDPPPPLPEPALELDAAGAGPGPGSSLQSCPGARPSAPSARSSRAAAGG